MASEVGKSILTNKEVPSHKQHTLHITLCVMAKLKQESGVIREELGIYLAIPSPLRSDGYRS